MKNKQNKEGSVPGSSAKQQAKKADITSLPRMEMYAVLGLELGQRIFEKLQKVEDSLEILAREKARELNPDQAETEAGQ